MNEYMIILVLGIERHPNLSSVYEITRTYRSEVLKLGSDEKGKMFTTDLTKKRDFHTVGYLMR